MKAGNRASRSNKVALEEAREIEDGDEEESCGSGEPAKVIDLRTASRQWAVYGKHRFTPCEEVQDKLDPGQYTIAFNESLGIHFVKKIVEVDDLLELPDNASEEILKDISTFWSREDFFRKFGYLWKRGILLWGPPGSGKTCLIQILSKKITEIGGISIYADGDPGFVAKGLQSLRHIEPSRPIILIFEDLDAIIKTYGENALLALLDGELQIDNMVSIATTNYPETLDDRIANRPSRFDLIKEIGMPTSEARKKYLQLKHPALAKDADELDKWVSATKKFSIAHLKELIVSVECLGQPFDGAIVRIKDMIEGRFKLTSEKYKENNRSQGFGFNPD